jgi:hypothetical protein
MVDLLKHPGAGPRERSTLLRHLGRHFRTTIPDVWALVGHLEARAPDIDLSAPLVRKAAGPDAQRAAEPPPPRDERDLFD